MVSVVQKYKVWKLKQKQKSDQYYQLLSFINNECINDFSLAKQIKNINAKEIKAAKKVFKKYYKLNNYLSVVILSSKFQVNNVKEKNALYLLKAISYLNYISKYKLIKGEEDDTYSKAKSYFNKIISYNLTKYNLTFARSFERLKVDPNLILINNDINASLDQKKQNVYKDVVTCANCLYDEIINSFDYKILINDRNYYKYVVDYSFLKYETDIFLSKKVKSRYTIFERIEYSVISENLVILLDKIKRFIDDDYADEQMSLYIIRNISESLEKVRLSDEPPINKRQFIGIVIRYILLLSWALFILYPTYIFVKEAFNGYHAMGADFTRYMFSFKGFVNLFDSNSLYPKWLTNSLIIGATTMIFTLFFCGLTAYAFSRFRYKGKKQYFVVFLVTQLIPTFTGVIVYYIFVQIMEDYGLPKYFSLIIIYTGGAVVGNTLILKSYMDSISHELDDAAIIDGCSYTKIFFSIIIPLSAPILILIAVWSFTAPFGDVILPRIILNSPDDYTVALGLYYWITPPSGEPSLANFQGYITGGLVIAVPIATLFICLQKFVVEGLSLGGVKG